MPSKPYDRDSAVTYAHRWAYGRNPRYYDFEQLGGDCTNFASQCIFAGSGIMNYTPTMGWYYIGLNSRAPAWSGVNELHRFLVNNRGPGPYAVEVPIDQAMPGDLAQLSFDETRFHHSPVIVRVGAAPSVSNILVAAHTFDADNRPLNSYAYARVRFIHIQGVRLS